MQTNNSTTNVQTFMGRAEGTRARLLDAEATLHFLRDRESLNNILDQGCPDVVLGALISHVYDLVGGACGDLELMIETHSDDFLAEFRKSVAEARDHHLKCDKEVA